MVHMPGPPNVAEPPEDLRALVATLRHPNLARVGLTTTREGRWALMAWVRRGVPVPIPEVEAQAKGHPVVYQTEPKAPPVARPAFPGRGE